MAQDQGRTPSTAGRVDPGFAQALQNYGQQTGAVGTSSPYAAIADSPEALSNLRQQLPIATQPVAAGRVDAGFAQALQNYGQQAGAVDTSSPYAAIAGTAAALSNLRQQQPLATQTAAADATDARGELAKLGATAAQDVATGGAGADIAAAQRWQIEFLTALQQAGGPGREAAAQQAALAATLLRRAQGLEEGAGQLQLRRALEQAQAQTASQVAGLRGVSPAAAQRLLVQQQAAQAQTAAGQSAVVALQEQEAAQKQLAGLLESTRGQDIVTQANVANQIASQLTQTRSGDIEGEDRAKRTAAAIFEGIRTGDQAMVNAAIAEAQNRRMAEIQLLGQQLGFITDQGRLDLDRARTAIDAKIRQSQLDLDNRRITAEQAARDQAYWANIWGTVLRVAAGAATGAIAGSAIGGVGAIPGAIIGGLTVAAGGSQPAQAVAQQAMPVTSVPIPPATGKARGGRIDGRGMVPGDHPVNDVVPAMLSPGEIVLPRSIAQAEDAPEKAAAFVRALQRTEAQPLSRRAAAQKIAQLEAELAALRAARGGDR